MHKIIYMKTTKWNKLTYLNNKTSKSKSAAKFPSKSKI